MVRDGRLAEYSRLVLVERRNLLDLRTRAAAALLLAGGRSVLSRHTAARLLGCSAADDAPIHVLVDYHRKVPRVPGLVIHQGLFVVKEVATIDGLRVQPLDIAIAEMLCRASRRSALACVDQALALARAEDREDFRSDVAYRISTRRDPRGRKRATILLDLATGLAESPAESWLLLDLFDVGFPVPAQQFPILDLDGRERYRLDFAWEEARIALEYDGFAAHVGMEDRDSERDEYLRRRGWTTIRASSEDLRDPSWLHSELRRAFYRRGLPW